MDLPRDNPVYARREGHGCPVSPCSPHRGGLARLGEPSSRRGFGVARFDRAFVYEEFTPPRPPPAH
jgi:hypothetical protein